ncbi:MAG TPA: cation:dicarboxylase symporter family transporter [Steroidobacteraceae bacterium]|nr:cation:dicarboxylase symporter family transporter [Steroidobacteraceae bacterium]
MSPTARVLLGLASGAALGIGLALWNPPLAASAAGLVQPIGRLWLNALQMTVVPLVVALVVVGVAATSDAAASGRTARRAMVVFLVLLSAGAAFAAFWAPLQLTFLPRDPALIESFRAAIGTPPAVSGAPTSFGDWFTAIIPSNAIAAAAQNAMLSLVVFALFFGFALTRIAAPRRAQAVELFQTLAETMVVIVRWVLWAAPLGVFALALTVCVSAGVSVLSALGWYILAQCSLYLLVTLALYAVAVFGGGQSLRRFAAAIVPAQVIAASTQSSLATLPAMVETAQTRLGCARDVTSLVLPMAVSLFRMTSPVQYIGVSSFIAWIYGVDLSAPQLIVAAALAVVISLGSVGLPGQVSLMAMNMPVVQSLGLPIAPLGLMLAVETIPDVFATLGNVTGDLAATTVVSRRAGAAAQPLDAADGAAIVTRTEHTESSAPRVGESRGGAVAPTVSVSESSADP